MAPWHTPTLAENHQNDSFFNFWVRQIHMLSRNTQVPSRTHLAPPAHWVGTPELSYRITTKFGFRLPTILPREEKWPKEEKVRYKSLRTASRRPRTCGNTWKARIWLIYVCGRIHNGTNVIFLQKNAIRLRVTGEINILFVSYNMTQHFSKTLTLYRHFRRH